MYGSVTVVDLCTDTGAKDAFSGVSRDQRPVLVKKATEQDLPLSTSPRSIVAVCGRGTWTKQGRGRNSQPHRERKMLWMSSRGIGDRDVDAREPRRMHGRLCNESLHVNYYDMKKF